MPFFDRRSLVHTMHMLQCGTSKPRIPSHSCSTHFGEESPKSGTGQILSSHNTYFWIHFVISGLKSTAVNMTIKHGLLLASADFIIIDSVSKLLKLRSFWMRGVLEVPMNCRILTPPSFALSLA